MSHARSVSLTTLATILCSALPWGCYEEANTCADSISRGELIINEIMGDVDGSDNGFEWIEIYNGSTRTIDLEGLSIVVSKIDGSSEKVHIMSNVGPILPGDYLVLGNVLEFVKPDYVDYCYEDSLGSLRNSDGRIALMCGSAVIDEALYGEFSEDKSLQFDGYNWCDSRSTFETDRYGTPGGQNETCQ